MNTNQIEFNNAFNFSEHPTSNASGAFQPISVDHEVYSPMRTLGRYRESLAICARAENGDKSECADADVCYNINSLCMLRFYGFRSRIVQTVWWNTCVLVYKALASNSGFARLLIVKYSTGTLYRGKRQSFLFFQTLICICPKFYPDTFSCSSVIE